MSPTVLALDIGGANLKAAHTSGAVRTHPFALWRNPNGLTDALRTLIAALPAFDRLAVTMTGELCDCYPTRRAGVLAILDAVEAAASGAPVRVWSLDCKLLDLEAARARPMTVAAANWLALAAFLGGHAPEGSALVLDIGSTTTDVVPLLDGKPVPQSSTDIERLRCGELVYTGVGRTPLMTLMRGDGAAELFATTADLYRVLEMVPEDPNDCDTADGRPATRENSHARLARMICGDLETTTVEERCRWANVCLARHVHAVRSAVERVAQRLPQPLRTVFVSGSGEFLAMMALQPQPSSSFRFERGMSFASGFGAEASRAACAHALAVLASEAWT
jgi:probable H4MPT-linked C1 transfer pathway protein